MACQGFVAGGLHRRRVQGGGNTRQGCSKGLGGLKPLGRVLLQRDHNDFIKRFGQVGHHLDRGQRSLLKLGHHDVEIALALERPRTGDQFVKRHPHRVQVRTAIQFVALHLLSRHVEERTHGGARLGQLLVGLGFGDAKVHELDDVVRGQHHVGGFDIAVNDAVLMSVTERRKDLRDIAEGIPEGDRPRFRPFLQGGAFDVLHDHEELIFLAKRGAEAGDVGMIQTCQHLDFANEPVSEVRVIGKVGQ